MQTIQIIEKKKTKTLKVIICLPGSSYSGTFLQCWTEFISKCLINNITPILSQQYDPVIYFSRNKCLGGNVLLGKNQEPYNGKIDYNFMLWIDSDIIFKYEDFQQLLSRNVNIISGLYMMEGGRNFAVVKDWNTEYFKKNGSFKFLDLKDIEEKKDIIEVSYTGLGFFLVKKGVFESIEYPWFRPIFQEISKTIYDFSSEDTSICQLFREKGLKIYIDPLVRVGHEKKVIY